MNKIKFIVYLISTTWGLTNVFPQASYIDSILFKKLNNYRIENGIEPLIWSEDCYIVASHHAKYLIDECSDSINIKKSCIITHYEFNNDKYSTLYKRWQNLINKKINAISEITNIVFNFGCYDEKTNMFTACKYNEDISKKTLDLLAEKMIESYKKSESHNKAMLRKEVTHAAFRCEMYRFHDESIFAPGYHSIVAYSVCVFVNYDTK